MAAKEKTPTYGQAFAELQKLISDLEREEIQVDELVEKIKRASVLLQICKAKLNDTEKEAEALLRQINEEE